MKNSLLVIMLLLPLACQKTITPDLQGAVTFRLQGDFAGIDRVDAGVTGADFDTLKAAISLGTSEVSGSIENVPVGKGRTVFARLFDGIVLKYRGEQRFDIGDDKPVSLNIVLLPVDMFSPPGFWASDINGWKDTLYNIYWNRYPDSVEFAELRMSYLVVMDDAGPIGSTFDLRTMRISPPLLDTTWTLKPGSEEKAYFRVFIYTEKFREYLPGDSLKFLWNQ